MAKADNVLGVKGQEPFTWPNLPSLSVGNIYKHHSSQFGNEIIIDLPASNRFSGNLSYVGTRIALLVNGKPQVRDAQDLGSVARLTFTRVPASATLQFKPAFGTRP